MYKCRILGQKENLGQIDEVLLSELNRDEDIDWKLAFVELENFVEKLKLNYFKELNEKNSYSEFILL